MKRASAGLGLVLVLAGCSDMPLSNAGQPNSGGTGFREYLVLGSTMNFEECRARGGIIIEDIGSPMVACDPRVRRQPVPADEFDHPGSPVPQIEEIAGAAQG